MFNLTCNIYDFGSYPVGPPRLTGVACQWRGLAKETSPNYTNSPSYPAFILSEILLPAGTDVRGNWDGVISQQDTLELIVAGGMLPFAVSDVLDVGKGFTNEYRVAHVVKVPPWPVPIP